MPSPNAETAARYRGLQKSPRDRTPQQDRQAATRGHPEVSTEDRI